MEFTFRSLLKLLFFCLCLKCWCSSGFALGSLLSYTFTWVMSASMALLSFRVTQMLPLNYLFLPQLSLGSSRFVYVTCNCLLIISTYTAHSISISMSPNLNSFFLPTTKSACPFGLLLFFFYFLFLLFIYPDAQNRNLNYHP